MKSIHFHPDQRIILRDGDDVLYTGTIEETKQIVGEFPALPEGVTEIQFDIESEKAIGFGKTGQLDHVDWTPGNLLHGTTALELAGAEKKAMLQELADPTSDANKPSEP